MQLTKLKCSYCKKILYRTIRRNNESKKFGWKSYCSPKCRSEAKIKLLPFICSNPSCSKSFRRIPSALSKSAFLYCSRSCAVKINNSKFPKRQALVRQCEFCQINFTGKEKYCSIECKNKNQTITKEKIIREIKKFYLKNGRIPLKREFCQEKAARNRFSSWNQAIKSAGLNPNPVKFAKKHFAKDGHKCDSLAEKIIDDWIYKRNVAHSRSVPYPEGKGFSADFVIENRWIEFFGLHGEHKRYDEIRKIKLKIVKKHNLNLVEIFPKDLFPKNKLSQILKF